MTLLCVGIVCLLPVGRVDMSVTSKITAGHLNRGTAMMPYQTRIPIQIVQIFVRPVN